MNEISLFLLLLWNCSCSNSRETLCYPSSPIQKLAGESIWSLMELTSSLVIVEVGNAFHDWFTLVSRHTLKNITHQRIRHVPGSCTRNIEETSRVIAISCAIRGACRSFYGLSLCLKTQQEASFSFPERYSESEKGWDCDDIFAWEVLGWGEFVFILNSKYCVWG